MLSDEGGNSSLEDRGPGQDVFRQPCSFRLHVAQAPNSGHGWSRLPSVEEGQSSVGRERAGQDDRDHGRPFLRPKPLATVYPNVRIRFGDLVSGTVYPIYGTDEFCLIVLSYATG